MPQEDSKGKSSASNMGIERMYQIYEKLNSAEVKQPLETEYREFLDAAHRSDKEKRLASQFITRFVEYFPNSHDDAVNAMLDLCEEEDPVIRKQVLKDLVTVCKKVKTCVPKVADVFCQLMLTADSTELQQINAGIVSLFHINARGTLAGIFAQIRDGEDVVRDAGIKLLSTHIKELSPEIATLQFQRGLYNEVKRIIRWTTEEEYAIFMDLVMSTKLMKQVGAQRLMIELLYEQIGLDSPFEIENKGKINSLFKSTDKALSIYNAQISPDRLITYYFTNILPAFDGLQKFDNVLSLKQGILKRLVELLMSLNKMDEPDLKKCLDSATEFAFDVLPPVPIKEEEEIIPKEEEEESTKMDVDGVEKAEEGEAVDGEVTPLSQFNFSQAECSLYFLHKLGSLLPDYLANYPKIEELRLRMQYLNRGAMAFQRKIRGEFKDYEKVDLSTIENKTKVASLKVIKSLNTLIRDLFQKPQKYSAIVVLSWKPLMCKLPVKRPTTAPAAFFSNSKPKVGRDREIQRYQPPGGKYSRGGNFGSGGGGGPAYGGIRRGGGRSFPGSIRGGGLGGGRGSGSFRRNGGRRY